MSAIEMIFENKVVLISLLAVIIPQAVALLLVIGMLTRRTVKFAIEKKKQQELRRREDAREMSATLENELPELDMSGIDEIEASKTQEQSDSEEETPTEDERELSDEEESENADGENDSDMQSLLADVFVDDTMDRKAELLLGDMETMSIENIVEFAQSINERLAASGE